MSSDTQVNNSIGGWLEIPLADTNDMIRNGLYLKTWLQLIQLGFFFYCLIDSWIHITWYLTRLTHQSLIGKRSTITFESFLISSFKRFVFFGSKRWTSVSRYNWDFYIVLAGEKGFSLSFYKVLEHSAVQTFFAQIISGVHYEFHKTIRFVR